MAGSSYGKIFRINTWGESHGAGIGAVVDGCPAGIPLDESYIQIWLDRRRPGRSSFSTQRNEGDRVQILSGVFDGKTTGTPISMIIPNEDQHSSDYSEFSDAYRPGHADRTYDLKYGLRDWRGGGRASGRETAGRVAGGAVAARILAELGITVCAYTKSIGPVIVDDAASDLGEVRSNPFFMPSSDCAAAAAKYVEECIKKNDSAGGVIECRVNGCPAGLGEPVFDKLDAELAKAVMSIGAVKGVEIGDGFSVAQMTGSVNNDLYDSDSNGSIIKCTNHSGGILGGISDGSEIVLRAAVKPTPSISQLQRTVHADGTAASLTIKGRHDPLIVPRAVVVVESMVCSVIADALMCGASSRIDSLRRIYS